MFFAERYKICKSDFLATKIYAKSSRKTVGKRQKIIKMYCKICRKSIRYRYDLLFC